MQTFIEVAKYADNIVLWSAARANKALRLVRHWNAISTGQCGTSSNKDNEGPMTKLPYFYFPREPCAAHPA